MTCTINASASNNLQVNSDGSGVLKVQSNGVTTNALAWVIFGGGNGTTSGAILNSYNVSSVTANATGDWTVTYTTAMPNANSVPIAQGFGPNTSTNYATTQAGYNGLSTTATQIKHWESNAANSVQYVVLAVFGN